MLMCISNPVRSVGGFLLIIPSKFINVHRPALLVLTPSRSGYTHTHCHSPACHCPVTSNQECEPLLASSLAMSMIFFILEYAPLVMLEGSIPEYEIRTCLNPWICQNKFFCLYFDRFGYSPLFITGMYFCTCFPTSSPTDQSSKPST